VTVTRRWLCFRITRPNVTRLRTISLRPATVPGMSARFSTEVVSEGDAIVIYVSGEVDVAACERLRDVLEPNMGPKQTIVLDLSGVEFMDSSSLRYLVQARGDLTADGGSLKLRNPSVAAHRLLTLAKAETLLEDDAEQHRSD
jgi:anti-anti-sigma factor